jgi:RNA polymerase sigma factor (sigma-70 family)
MNPPTAHDDERCARLYKQCKRSSVGFARRLLRTTSHNRHLCAFDAEELYDTAWEAYYSRREYLEERDDHVARLNALILSRFRDELRRSRAQKRTPPGQPATSAGSAPADMEDRVVDRDQLRHLLAGIRNPDDARALVDHEVRGLTFAEIGESEGITAEAARRRAERARRQAGARRRTRGGRHE